MKLTGVGLWMVCMASASCSTGTTTETAYTVGGTVKGLTGTLVLANNTQDSLTIAANGTFAFATSVKSGATYSVSVVSQPTGEICSLANKSGVVGSQNITNVTVTCAPTTESDLYTVGGTVTGLAGATGSLVLINGADQATVTSSGSFTFPTQVSAGTSYTVAVSALPTGFVCTVSNGAGQVASANVTSVSVACVSAGYSVGGNIVGATGPFVAANGNTLVNVAAGQAAYTFPGVQTGASYSIVVHTPPLGQVCSVAYGSGVMGNANVTNVAISCATASYTVTGTIANASGALILANGGALQTIASGTTSFSFGSLHHGDSYAISVNSAPPGQTCAMGGPASGTINASNIAGVTVTCTTLPTYSLNGSVQGATAGLVLSNSSKTVSVPYGTSAFSFSGIPGGASYDITVSTPPAGQFCSVTSGGQGVVGNVDVNGIVVSCQTLYIIGTINGSSDGLILQSTDNAAGVLTQYAASNSNSTFQIGGYVPLDTYSLNVYASSIGSSCLLSGAPASGTVQNSNITGFVVNCTPITYQLTGTIGPNALTDPNIVVSMGSDSRTLSASSGYFTFAGLVNGTTYTLTAVPEDTTKSCTVGPRSTFTVTNSNFVGVVISCQ